MNSRLTSVADDPVVVATRTWLAANLPERHPVVVACSGGTDSLALAVAVKAVTSGGDRRVVAATVDHGLQPGSAERAAMTADLLRRVGFAEVEVLTVTVDGPGGMEAAARNARYSALRELADGVGAGAGVGAGVGAGRESAAVLLAHTLDDQAETVLLGLARGSGPRSVAGMRAWRAPWGRPLLAVGRAQTEATCRAVGLTPWHDPHNSDPAFTRVRLRHEVLPLLDEVLGGGVRPALARTASLMAQDLDALDEIARAVLHGVLRADGALDIPALAGQPAAVIGRVLRTWVITGGGGPLTFEHLSRMTAQVTDRTGPAQVRIPGGIDVVKAGSALRLIPFIAGPRGAAAGPDAVTSAPA